MGTKRTPETEDSTSGIPLKTKCAVYATHTFTCLGARMWWFGIGLFMIEVTPQSLQLTATYGFTNGGAMLLLSAVVGDVIDRTARLKAARLSLILNNGSIIVCNVAIFFIINYRHAIEVTWDNNALLTLCFAIVVILTIFSNLCNLGRVLIMERDWIVEICGRSKDKIATMSATFRFFDLCTKVVAPLATGQIMTYTSYTTGALFIAGWNIFSVVVEYFLITRLYYMVPNLHTKRKSIELELSPTKHSGQSEEETDAFLGKDKEVKDSRSKAAEPKKSFTKTLFSSIISLYRGWRYYIRYDVWLAGLALAFLYFTVLGFDNITMGYAASQGLSESMVGVLVGAAAVFGIIASVSYPFLRRKIGLVRTGVLALTCQVSCLCLCVISLWLPGGTFNPSTEWGTGSPSMNVNNDNMTSFVVNNTTVVQNYTTNLNVSGNVNTTETPSENVDNVSGPKPAIVVLMMGIVGARFGVWLIDLTVSQLFMEAVEESERGIVNGFQSALNKLMDMLKFVLVLFIHDPRLFGYPALVSFCFICSAWILYARFVCRKQGYLCVPPRM